MNKFLTGFYIIPVFLLASIITIIICIFTGELWMIWPNIKEVIFDLLETEKSVQGEAQDGQRAGNPQGNP